MGSRFYWVFLPKSFNLKDNMYFLSRKLFSLSLIIAALISCTPSEREPKSFVGLSDEELTAVADSLAKTFIMVDGHVDLPYRMNVKGFMITKTVEDVSIETTGNFDYPKTKRGGLDAPFMSIYVPSRYQETGGAKEFADSLITMVSRVPEAFPDMFAMANSPQEIKTNFQKGLVSLPMGMENGAPIEDDIDNVKYFFDRGIRYITLTHSKDNQICDSSYDTAYTWNGVSPFGEQVIEEMNKWGIMVDISHVTDSAAFDALRLTKAPVIASHSSARKFTPDFERNMPDTLIKAMAENGGVIHINFGSTFLDGEIQDYRNEKRDELRGLLAEKGLQAGDEGAQEVIDQFQKDNPTLYSDVQMVANHIDNVVELAGIEHVGLGSDYDGVGDSLPTGLKDVSQYPNLIKELLKRGYSEEDISKILYKNVFRVWQAVEDHAATM